MIHKDGQRSNIKNITEMVETITKESAVKPKKKKRKKWWNKPPKPATDEDLIHFWTTQGVDEPEIQGRLAAKRQAEFDDGIQALRDVEQQELKADAARHEKELGGDE